MSRYRGAEGRRAGSRSRAGGTCAFALAALAPLAGLFVALASGAAPSPMSPLAHTSGHVHVSSVPDLSSWAGALPASGGIAIALLALSGVCLGPIRRRPRQAAVASLALLVSVLALETAVHSVHHLSDADAAAGCAVLSASQHVVGAGGGGPDVGAPAVVARVVLVDEGGSIRALPPFSPFEGRAPPVSPSI